MKPTIYINGASALSIQDTLYGYPDGFVAVRERFMQAKDSECFMRVKVPERFMQAKEPDFKEFIPPIIARRMSRIIKRAITVSQLALQEAGVAMPDAIIFGTGLGCIEDTEKFLNAVLEQKEQFLQPSFFIQSTHNTIASQVAIRLGCHGYNNTLVQRGLSFESALLDSLLLFEEGKVHSILTGGHDELTPTYFTLLNKAGYYSFDEATGIGNFAGEGSVSFLLSDERKEVSYAILQRLEMYYTDGEASFGSLVLPFLQREGVSPDELCAVVTAYTEDKMGKTVYRDLSSPTFAEVLHIPFKACCGEFFCASAFGLWLSINFLRISSKNFLLLHNHSFNKHHSIILLKKVA